MMAKIEHRALMSSAPVGFFDSGVGGLCVREAFRRRLPREDTVYIADTAHCPYGNRPAAEIVRLARRHVRALLARGCKMVVVACNTATAAAIDVLRATWPDVPFVGMEPAVKPAVLRSKSGVVGVLATQGTFNGRLYRETCARFARKTTVLASVADDFVELVERGETEGPRAEAAVRARVEPLLAAGAQAAHRGRRGGAREGHRSVRCRRAPGRASPHRAWPAQPLRWQFACLHPHVLNCFFPSVAFCQIGRARSPPYPVQLPLGYTKLKSLGIGSSVCRPRCSMSWATRAGRGSWRNAHGR